MSKIDLIYLGIVLFGFIGFAAVLAYYSQICAGPAPKQKETDQRQRVAAVH
ncbi:MAG: hypothetical protein ACRECI_05235 [Methyloceanibacter sp.]